MKGVSNSFASRIMRQPGARRILLIHGLYLAVTGLWPIVHLRSFMWVTGPKTDVWLVKTVGLLIFYTSLCLLYSWYRSRYSTLIFLLAVTNAFAFAFIDIYYASEHVICKVYLIDACAQMFFLVAHSIVFAKRQTLKRRVFLS
jgi:hypothetical protein